MSDRETLADLIFWEFDGGEAEPYEIAGALIEKGVRPPAQVITDPAELDALPVGSIVLHPRGDGLPKIARGWCVPGHMKTYTAADVLAQGSVTVLYVPTEDCPHDSRSGADGRWRCDQCGADCGPNTDFTKESAE